MPEHPAPPDPQIRTLALGLEVLVTLQPSALLRGNPEQREPAFEAFVADLRQAQRLFGR